MQRCSGDIRLPIVSCVCVDKQVFDWGSVEATKGGGRLQLVLLIGGCCPNQ
jgi:hypothetical protein